LAKCVFAIALAEEATLFDHLQNQKPKRVATKNRSKAVAFAQNTISVVAKDDNPRFCLKRIEIFIMFDSLDKHCWDSFGSPFLADSVIFAHCDLVVGVHTLDVSLFLKETVKPYLTVWVGVGKRIEEGWWAFKMKDDGADKRGYGIKGCGSGQRRQAEKRV
jgi:hypothetical protein